MKLIDKLWNWGHLEGSHNECTMLDCHMTPEEFAEEYGIRRSFIISYGGNIQPPFDGFADRFKNLKEVKWSVLGDLSTPLPEDELGNTNDILACLTEDGNITGGMVDDFFSPERMERFTPEVLKKIRKKLNERGLDFWCVLYEHNIAHEGLKDYLDCFDGISFWIWDSEMIEKIPEYAEYVKTAAGDKKCMFGMYLWDYGAQKVMEPERFEKQLKSYFGFLKEGKIDGVIFCSSTVGDADLETNRILKDYIARYGQCEV